MKVSELIEALSEVDPDLPVYVRGYEDGVDDVTAVQPVTVVRDVWPDTWYYGDHSTDDRRGEGQGSAPGVQLMA